MMQALYEIYKYISMKKDSIGVPDICHVSKLQIVTLCNFVQDWSAGPIEYVQEVVRKLEDCLEKLGKVTNLPNRSTLPWPIDYSSKLDDSPELTPELASNYQTPIVILHLMVELGCVDMIVEVSTLESHLAFPC